MFTSSRPEQKCLFAHERKSNSTKKTEKHLCRTQNTKITGDKRTNQEPPPLNVARKRQNDNANKMEEIRNVNKDVWEGLPLGLHLSHVPRGDLYERESVDSDQAMFKTQPEEYAVVFVVTGNQVTKL